MNVDFNEIINRLAAEGADYDTIVNAISSNISQAVEDAKPKEDPVLTIARHNIITASIDYLIALGLDPALANDVNVKKVEAEIAEKEEGLRPLLSLTAGFLDAATDADTKITSVEESGKAVDPESATDILESLAQLEKFIDSIGK
jgi:hypothetical protein